MPCTPVHLAGVTAIVCTRGKRAKATAAVPCAARIPLDACSRSVGTTQRCCAISTFLCDWQLADGRTCDAPLCPEHARAIGPDRHLCPTHAAQRRDDDELAPVEHGYPQQGGLF